MTDRLKAFAPDWPGWEWLRSPPLEATEERVKIMADSAQRWEAMGLHGTAAWFQREHDRMLEELNKQ